jgi:hypothetical protein
MITKTTKTTTMTRLAVAGAALVLAGCVEGPSGLTIVQNQIPTVDTMTGACMVSGMRTVDRAALGTFDVALDQSYPYFLFPLVQNNLSRLSATGIEPNRIDVHSYEITIEPPPTVSVEWSAACPNQFDFPSPVQLLPGEAAASLVEAFRPCHADLLRRLMQQGKISSNMSERVIFRLIARAKGRHGSTEIRSEPFEYPVRVCYGCLQTGYPDPAFVDFAFPKVPPCARLQSNPYRGNPCNPAQDLGPVLCCARDAEGTQLECPGVPRAAPLPTK